MARSIGATTVAATVAAGLALGVARAAGDAGATTAVAADAPIILAAGDIAQCDGVGDPETAAIIDGYPGATVAAVGDLAYDSGTSDEFQRCYEPSWGRHKARTKPAPGNHEYRSGGGGYFTYFGAAAGQAGKGWYSYDLGSWHVVVLNSNCRPGQVDCSASSEQLHWLRNDLAQHRRDCTLAYWHHPLWTSGTHADDADLILTQVFWDVLYEHGADVIVNGHDHNYERFMPLNSAGAPDFQHGIRQFVVGTGGATLRGLKTRRAGSETFFSGSYGVLKLVLDDGRYEWEFLGTPGTTFTDTGANDCHGPPGHSPPDPPRVAGPPTGVWSNDDTIDVTWSGASPSASGVDGYSYSWTQNAADSPPTTKMVEENVTSATSPSLGSGEWWFHIRTKDNVGHWSAPVHHGPFLIDTAPPDTHIEDGPPDSSYSSSASFAFESEPDVRFECALDSGPFAGCASPATYSDLRLGQHRFQVRALDAAGNVDASPAERVWTIVAAPPPPAPPAPPGAPRPPIVEPVVERKTCRVPNVRGTTLNRARTAVNGAGCRLAVTKRVYSATIPFGRIVTQTPQPASRVPWRRVVKVTVSRGRPPRLRRGG